MYWYACSKTRSVGEHVQVFPLGTYLGVQMVVEYDTFSFHTYCQSSKSLLYFTLLLETLGSCYFPSLQHSILSIFLAC